MAILFDIRWLVMISAALMIPKILIWITAAKYYHSNHMLRTANMLFTGQYPTAETFDCSILKRLGFRTENYETFTYTLINDSASEVILTTKSRMIQWHISETEICRDELQNLFNALLSNGLATGILVIRTLKDLLKEVKK